MWFALAVAAFASDLQPAWSELRVGTALWQLPWVTHGDLDLVRPPLTGHLTFEQGFGERMHRWYAAVHVAGSRHVWSYPDRDLREADTHVRGEVRLGRRFSVDPHTDVDVALAASVDVPRLDLTELHPGGVVVLAAHWTGDGARVRPTASFEARLAPVWWGYTYDMACTQVCDQSFTFNNGGSGFIAGVGVQVP